jgi:glycosyltransferase involved in cell wall biosynthesis
LRNDIEADQSNQWGKPVSHPQISVLLCVYNGEANIGALLQSLLDQTVPDGVAHEVVVVDNNSTDGTFSLAERFALQNPATIFVVQELRQGKSYALNRGLQNVRGEICCVIDADQLLPPDYLATVWNTFQNEPSASFIGGKVLPLPEQRLPDWITREHWNALAICDYGPEAFTVDSQRFVCLLAGAFRTAAMRAAGGYREPLGIRPGRSGSVEDVELYERLVSQGETGRYTPEILVYHRVDEERCRRDYHRRWHFGHGKYFADWRPPSFEQSSFSVLGLPGHVIRRAFKDFTKMLRETMKGSREQSFIYELSLRFYLGYILRRVELAMVMPFGFDFGLGLKKRVG